jgi:hypothetical protein
MGRYVAVGFAGEVTGSIVGISGFIQQAAFFGQAVIAIVC